MRPLITLDPEALTETADAFTKSAEEGRSRWAWLKAKNAIAASDNASRLGSEFECRRLSENAKAEAMIAKLESDVQETDQALGPLLCELSAVASPLGFSSITERSDLEFLEHEPISLEELAGKHNVPPPEEKLSWIQRTGHKLLAGIGGGTVFGISLGLLTGKLKLLSLSDEWPMILLWSVLGMAVMTLVGASLFPLAKSLGGQLYRQGKYLPWLKGIQCLTTLLVLVGLALAMVMIESKVEQLGLFKALAEQSSLEGVHVSRRELLWVSLMIVIPIVSSYIVLGLNEGERQANLAALRSGLRISEALGLLRTKIDLGRGLLHVHLQLLVDDESGTWELSEPKSVRSVRTLVLEPEAIKAIRQQLAMAKNERQYVEDYEDNGLVFASLRGTPAGRRSVQHRLDEILDLAGLDHCGLHDLRRTCLTNLANRGLPMHQLQAYAGHASIETTAKYYLGVSLEAQKAAIVSLKPLSATAMDLETKDTMKDTKTTDLTRQSGQGMSN